MANPPIHRLANELLSHIFSFCPSSFNDFLKSSYKTNHRNGAVALRVSHVSRHWRAASHATPSLWRTITAISFWLGEYDYDEGLLELQVERVKHYLKLSGKLPLRIVLADFPTCKYDDGMDGYRLAATEPLIYQLTGENHRWELFYADLPSEYFADILGLTGPMPLLTELHLKVEDSGVEEEVPCLYADEFEAPRLERLTIYGLELQDPQDIFCFAPNSALRHVSVGKADFNKAVPIVNAASADMAVELSMIYFYEVAEERINCSSHSLSINTSELENIFPQLTLASSVKTLEFCFEQAAAMPFPLESFKGVLSQSSSSVEITNFALRSSQISDTHLLNLLAVLPSLTHLTIEEHAPAARLPYSGSVISPPPLSRAFFDVLADSLHDSDYMTFKAGGKASRKTLSDERWLDHFGGEKPFDVSLCPLLPRLTDLVLVFHLSSITENTVKMIESRVRPASEGIARLQFVSLHYHGDLLDENSRLGLKKLGETEGLELDVKQLKS